MLCNHASSNVSSEQKYSYLNIYVKLILLGIYKIISGITDAFGGGYDNTFAPDGHIRTALTLDQEEANPDLEGTCSQLLMSIK